MCSSDLSRPQTTMAKPSEPPTRPAPQGAPPKRPSTPKTYTLKSGDTLAKIAKAQGITLQQLQNANPGLDTRKLKTGSEIKVP